DRLERAAASGFLLAEDLEKEGRWAEAAEAHARVFREYRATGTARDALLREAACRARFDAPEKVLALADSAAARGEGSEEVRAALTAAAAEAARARRDPLAARLHEAAYRVLPRVENLLGAGAAFERAGENEAARNALEMAAVTGAGTPPASEALYRLGLLYEKEGGSGKAAEAFDRAGEEGGGERTVELLSRAGNAWLSAGDAKRAADRLARAVEAFESGEAGGAAEEAHAAKAYIGLSRAKESAWGEEVGRWRRGGSGKKAGLLLEERIGLYRSAIALRFEGTTETAAREAGEILERYGRTALLREWEAGRIPAVSLVESSFGDAAILFLSAGEEGRRRLGLYADLADTLIEAGEGDRRASPPPPPAGIDDPDAYAERLGAALKAIERADEKWGVAAELLIRQEAVEGENARSTARTALALRAAESLEEGAELLRRAPEPTDLAGEDLALYRSLVEEKALAFEARAASWLLSLPGAAPEVVSADVSCRTGGDPRSEEGGIP
ncbi:MAG: hypothetical protein ABIH26_11035, partial [Candidatus Eisenbacteria bacterium]